MHLVQSLASGINGAANGSVQFIVRGTSTPASWYGDFEATQANAASNTPTPLDGNGGLVAYVNQLVDVRVFDVNGVLLREFVAGDNASAIEVISQSFTGIDYVTGQSGVGKPTTLQAILDLLIGSFGQADFNVTAGGIKTTLVAALASISGLFFNVKSFGAIGNGVADDSGPITAAILAAHSTLNTGGIVFFPPGIYRIASTVVVTGQVSLFGCGGSSTKIAVDNVALGAAVQFNGTTTFASQVQGLWFGGINTVFPAPLVSVSGVGVCVDFIGCQFGADAFTSSILLQCAATGTSSLVTVDKCKFYQNANAVAMVQSGAGVGRVIVRSTNFIVPIVGTYSTTVLGLVDGVVVDGCYFDGQSVTAGAFNYIGFAPGTWGSCAFTNNQFKANNTVGVTALRNLLAVPQYDCYESGNQFGDPTIGFGGITPYAYTTDGYGSTSVTGWHGSRTALTAPAVLTNANVTVPAKAVGSAVILRNGAGAQVISATDKGRLGDRFLLQICNNSGGVVAPTFGGLLTVRPGYVANINNSGLRTIEFVWMGDLNNTANGIWLQVAVESGG